jgi:hypothetical protein
VPSLQIRSSFCLRQSISIQSLLEALTGGTARAVTKRNNATVVLILAPMITLFFFISISDGYSVFCHFFQSEFIWIIWGIMYSLSSHLQYGYSGLTNPSGSQILPTVLQKTGSLKLRQYHSASCSLKQPKCGLGSPIPAQVPVSAGFLLVALCRNSTHATLSGFSGQ